MKDFSILFPTRERPDLLKGILESILLTTSELDRVEVLVAYDDDDVKTQNFIQQFESDYPFVVWHKGPRSLNFSRDYYTNLFKHSSGRWIIVCNDDAEFRTVGWDRIAKSALMDKSNIIMGWIEDGLGKARQWDLGNYCCFPLIGREGAEALGYIFPARIPTWGADIWIRKLYDNIGAVLEIPITVYHLNHWNQSRPQDQINKRIQENQISFDVNPTYEEINLLVNACKRSMANAV